LCFGVRGSVRRAVVLAGILLAGFCSPGMVVISRVLIVLRRESARDWVRSGREFLRLMVRAGAVVDKIAEVSAYIGEGLGQVMGLVGEISQELSFRDVIRKLFGEDQVVILNLNPRELLVLAQEMTI
jgi:hypothetical protein